MKEYGKNTETVKSAKLAANVESFYKPTDWTDFPTITSVRKDTLHDLVEFDKYVSFEDFSFDAVKIREAIVSDINMTTPPIPKQTGVLVEPYTIDGFNQTNFTSRADPQPPRVIRKPKTGEELKNQY